MKSITRRLVHPFPPVIDQECRVLILGSVPSVKSVEQNFYYMNKLNRFWKMISQILGEDLTSVQPSTRRDILLSHHIALYDSVYECEIKGSSDASVKIITPTNVKELIRNTKISKILCNGKLSYKIAFENNADLQKMMVAMPSTSSANAQFRLDALIETWKKELEVLK